MAIFGQMGLKKLSKPDSSNRAGSSKKLEPKLAV